MFAMANKVDPCVPLEDATSKAQSWYILRSTVASWCNNGRSDARRVFRAAGAAPSAGGGAAEAAASQQL